MDAATINHIAAGEVVERPISVAKELVENSIDAGASSITVEIKDGGASFLRVTDNGCGIRKDQLRTAFLQHATSKIATQEDLNAVTTLGFRGEALSSIAAVAQVEMITKAAGEITGARIQVNGSDVASLQDVGCVGGTTVIVRNLFFNVPVRRRFLKKPGAEAGLISDMINKLALGHPEIAFKYISNGVAAIMTNGGGDLKSAAYSVYGKELVGKMMAVEGEASFCTLSGLIGKPETARASRALQNFFINGRYVRSEILQSAMDYAYKTLTMTGKFPAYILSMRIRPELVDVNVHPNKLEIRFQDEEAIGSFVRGLVAKGLSAESLIPDAMHPAKTYSQVAGGRSYAVDKNQYDLFSPEIINKKAPSSMSLAAYEKLEEKGFGAKGLEESSIKNESFPQDESLFQDELFIREESLLKDEGASVPSSAESGGASYINAAQADESGALMDDEPKRRKFFTRYNIVGQIFQTYWIVEQSDSVYFIDQHAAHERILYERLMERLKEGILASQILLRPIMASISQGEKQVLDDNIDLFTSFGFEIEELDEKTCAIRAVPHILGTPASSGFFFDILDKLGKLNPQISNVYEMKLDAIAEMACKAAVKANDRLSLEEAKALIEEMLALENPFTCPHGRPTILKMTKYEWEKKFKRVH
ncbi:MAG: DNA mismatch repair endonuclease MutL [Clostridiales bacterium]|nr:DNA mismatch repair endonuclease MutL [Clostridiales bacterium]